MNKNHEKKKRLLKILGLSMLVCGVICEVIGFVALFKLDKNGYLWILTIIGIPLTFSSIGLITTGFAREFAKYNKNEYVSVIKELKQELNVLENKTTCPNCNTENSSDSSFCRNCGKELSKNCPICNAVLSYDNKFCDKCGKDATK